MTPDARPRLPAKQAALLALLLLAACGGGAATAPTTTAAPTTAATTTTVQPTTTTAATTTTTLAPTTTLPPTTTVPKPTPGEAYLLLSGPYNLEVKDAAARLWPESKGNSLKAAKAFAAWYTVRLQQWMTDIKAVEWPAEVQPKIDAMLAADAVAVGRWGAVAHAQNMAGVLALDTHGADLAVSDAASAVRAALGIPIDR